MSVVWLTGATIIDGTGADPIENCAVAVENGHISALGGTPPTGAEVLGLHRADNHARPHRRTRSSRVDRAIPRTEPAASDLGSRARCRHVRDLRHSTLDGGFTTVRDCGGIDGGLAGVVASGKIPGPRIIQCGPIQCQTGGHGHLAAEWEPTSDWSDDDIPGLRCMSLAFRRSARNAKERSRDVPQGCGLPQTVCYRGSDH